MKQRISPKVAIGMLIGALVLCIISFVGFSGGSGSAPPPGSAREIGAGASEDIGGLRKKRTPPPDAAQNSNRADDNSRD